MEDARSLIEIAQDQRTLEGRRVVLEGALAVARKHDEDVVPVVVSMLVLHDVSLTEEAFGLIEDLDPAKEERQWASLHLAASCVETGQWESVLRAADLVSHGYFERNDLWWRSIHVQEWQAAALLRLGRFPEALRAAEVVIALLVEHQLEDDPAPPRILARAAIEAVAERGEGWSTACEILGGLILSLELEEWFDADFAQLVREAHGQCDR